jgi:hypothetical protein
MGKALGLVFFASDYHPGIDPAFQVVQEKWDSSHECNTEKKIL